jgi:type I restriction enzyme S subunit
VKAGDFVINSRSDRKGSSGVSESDGSVSLINIVMEPNDIFGSFCNYFLKSKAFVEENYRIGHGIVADLWTTRYDEMKNIIMAFPPKPEQQAIANFLDETCEKLDTVVAQKEKMIALLKERKQALIQNAVTRGLNKNVPMKDSGVDWIGEIPKNWEVKRLKFICVLNKESLPENLNKKQEINYVDIGSVTFEDGILSTEYYLFQNAPSRARKVAKNGDTIVSTVRTYLKAIDFIDENKSKYVYSTGFAILSPNKNILNKYLYNQVRADAFTEQVSYNSKGMSYPAINSTDLGRIWVCVPSKQEQEKIVNYIDAQSRKLDQAVTQQEQAIVKLKEYKASLIDSCVLGKIKVS